MPQPSRGPLSAVDRAFTLLPAPLCGHVTQRRAVAAAIAEGEREPNHPAVGERGAAYCRPWCADLGRPQFLGRGWQADTVGLVSGGYCKSALDLTASESVC